MNPFLLVISGAAGTGKTSLALLLSQKLRTDLICVDTVEKWLLKNHHPFAQENKYPQALSFAEKILERGQSVILEGSFRFSKTRRFTEALASEFGAHYGLVHCDCPESLASTRLSFRRRKRPGYYKKTAEYSYSKKFGDLFEDSSSLKIDSSQPLTFCARQASLFLYQRFL